MINEKSTGERVILAAVTHGDEAAALLSLQELSELARTAGAIPVGQLLQGRDRPETGTYIGSGKIEELKALCLSCEADGVIFDDELTPAQMRNLAQQLEVKVMDRTLLILDIFAAHAVTSEGRIQVELAQLQYRMTMLSGLGTSLSRLGGGIGTRGPGEKKLESDRRLIRRRISALKEQLSEADAHRQLIRDGQKRHGMPRAALVGYTNAGKSTLLNALTGAGVLEADKLFATLDPTTRGLVLPDGQQILLTDTVGFIRKLPHHLIEAFRSTLEEAVYADLILHVVDASNPQRDRQMHVVYETLRELGAADKPVITVFTKQDLVSDELPDGQTKVMTDRRSERSVMISAKTGEGLDELLRSVGDVLLEGQILIERIIPYTEGASLALIRRQGRILAEDYRNEGIYVKAYVPREIYGKL